MIPTMIEAALRSMLVALAVWAGLRVFRVRNVLAQKACWGLVLAAALLMPLLVRWPALSRILPPNASFIVSLDSFHTQSAPASSVSPVAPNLPAAHTSVPVVVEREPASTSPYNSAAEPAAPASAAIPASAPSFNTPLATGVDTGVANAAAPVQPQSHPRPASPLSIAWILYLAVAAAFLFRVFYGLASALLLWLNADPVPAADASDFAVGVPLRSSHAVASPVTIGSAVVLPADYSHWESEKLRIVLAHERSHIRQGDFYVQLLAALYAAAFWFSPLGWWLKRELSDLAETISDRAGLEQAASCLSYAQILLEFAAAPRPTPIGVAMARTGSLSRRIERLLNDNTFAQAFAGGRRRIVVAALLVPTALFAATCLVRVQAAQQVQEAQQTPAAQPAEAPQPAAAAQPDAPITGQSHPAPEAAPGEPVVEVDTDGPVAPDWPGPVIAPVAPVAPHVVVPRPPAVHSILVTPMNTPMIIAPPVPPITMVVPRIAVRVPSTMSLAFVQDDANATVDRNHFRYSYGRDGDSYAIISGDRRDTMNFSGDIHTSEIDKARQLAHGDFLWFRHEGKDYFVDDAGTIAHIEAMYKPMEELGKQQEVLGHQQDELGKQQEALGRLQEQASVPAPDLRKEMAEITDAMAKLQAKMGKNITQDELGDLQDKLGELQGRLGDLQGMVGAKQGELGEQQGRLGAQQGKLGAEQGRLGAEQGRIAEEADRQVRIVIDDSLKNGNAHPVQ
ncbi:MAG: M56 family metallopeptidase [Terracidiphilus sp.]